ncbi:hypothetical protein [Methylobacillus glycogenes]|uniref:hypothetical protein n=1 Tax=Methylobacillus glycogenes TaxID=406 RepID=UPI00046FB3A8|nr:hypothetical protein [Methylobacillus glycogenes]
MILDIFQRSQGTTHLALFSTYPLEAELGHGVRQLLAHHLDSRRFLLEFRTNNNLAEQEQELLRKNGVRFYDVRHLESGRMLVSFRPVRVFDAELERARQEIVKGFHRAFQPPMFEVIERSGSDGTIGFTLR